jgi:hypothetical protein
MDGLSSCAKYPEQKVLIKELLMNIFLDHYEFERKSKAFDN